MPAVMYNANSVCAVSKMGLSFESVLHTRTHKAVFSGKMHGAVSMCASFLSRKGSPRMFVMAQLSHKQRLHH